MKTIGKKGRKLCCLLLCVVWIATLLSGEAGEKRPFKIEDYAQWKSIVSTALSDDGNWIAYAYRRVRTDDEFFLKHINSGRQHAIPRGTRPLFSDDSKWAAYILSHPWKDAEALRKQKKPVPQEAQLINLESGEKKTFKNASSFIFSQGSSYLAVKKQRPDPKSKHQGSDLILVKLAAGLVTNLGHVSEYKFNKPGTRLAYLIDAPEKTGNGIYVMELKSGILRPLDTGKSDYSSLAWNESGTALAALKGTKPEKSREKENCLLAFTNLNEAKIQKHVFDPAQDPDFPKDMVLSERAMPSSRFRASSSPEGAVFWSKDGARIFCGIKEQEAEPEKPGKDQLPFPDVDIWHWKDERLQSVQKIQANRDRNFTYRSVWHVGSNRFLRLADESMRAVSLTPDGRWGIGRDDKAYLSDWKESRADYYRIDTTTGEKQPMFKAQKRTLGISPDSGHFLFWKDDHIWDYQIPEGKILNLSEKAPVSFKNTEYDHPGTAPPYGVTGWTKDGKAVILEHRYDLYLQPLNGDPAQCMTQGIGADKEIVFRYIATDPEAKFIDLKQPLLLTAFGRWTKEAGFYRLHKDKMTRLILDKKRFGRIVKAKKADRYLFTIEDAAQFPDYYVTGGNFSSPNKITDANPQLTEFFWGKNILIEYTNKQGVRLQGVLSIPETYQSGQKLPMLVDFYEKNSQNLHRFSRMIYRDTPMFYKYVSNGYLVLLPDVHFNTRTTHSDMLDCVEAAINKVIDLGYADPDRIGLHGHSFSGQGAVLIATRSHMFAAVVAGAAATDLISDFNQLWKSSGTNQHRYDYYGQGRFGTNPFDDRDLYIRESALFNAPGMNTPLLLLHGTDDGSVEWLQAIELYNALRFLGKNVILVSYPGEGHHMATLENKIDFQQRMEQFYDHYLKGKAAPEWMIKGIPYLKKKSGK